MQGNAKMLLEKNFPFNIEELFTQLYQYKCFEVNLKKALLMNDYSNLNTVYLINAYWFQHWKKVSCYDAIKDELSQYSPLQVNYQTVINNYFKIVEKIYLDEKVDNNIDNAFIQGDYDDTIGGFGIDEELEFDIISKELWDCFISPANMKNINNGTAIVLKLEELTKDSLVVHLNQYSCYILYWNRDKGKIGKIILKFDNYYDKTTALQNIISFGPFGNFYACHLEDLKKDKNINLQNVTCLCINKNKRNFSYEEYKKAKLPVGLNNVGMTCYMNAALQSLFHTQKITNFLLQFENAIRNRNYDFSLQYLEIVRNLSRRASGSKLKTSYSPKSFFDVIKREPEFIDYAGDSIDVIRCFMEKMNAQLMGINPQEQCSFQKYYINGNINGNILYQQKVLKLNEFLTKFVPTNKSIICNTFYFIEKYEFKCCNDNCGYVTTNFNCQRDIAFPLEEIRKQKCVNFIKKNGMNNFTIEMFNILYNNNFNLNNNNMMMNMNMFMNMNMNLNQMNNMNILKLMCGPAKMVNQNIKSVNLMECFEFYNNNKKMFTGTNQLRCQGCKMNTDSYQLNTIYSLPDVLVINLDRGKGNKYEIKVFYPEILDLRKYAEIQSENYIYELRCIVTHLGPSGTAGHYIAFCFVEKEKKWYKFDDSIVIETTFKDASTTGDSYLLFYKRTNRQMNIQINNEVNYKMDINISNQIKFLINQVVMMNNENNNKMIMINQMNNQMMMNNQNNNQMMNNQMNSMMNNQNNNQMNQMMMSNQNNNPMINQNNNQMNMNNQNNNQINQMMNNQMMNNQNNNQMNMNNQNNNQINQMMNNQMMNNQNNNPMMNNQNNNPMMNIQNNNPMMNNNNAMMMNNQMINNNNMQFTNNNIN